MQSASSAGVALGEEVRASTSARIMYRPDIDGLRAISVLAVILFHSAVPGFAGGYVGVDVFFVISGYLITQVLMASPERTLGGRLRELLRTALPADPARAARDVARDGAGRMLAVSAERLVALRHLLGATSVFAGNVVAWRSGGYFEIRESVQSVGAPLVARGRGAVLHRLSAAFSWRAARLEAAGSSR